MLMSIIMVTLNAEKFLPRLLQSLEDQIDKNFELVVYDGESTDGTLEILSMPRNFSINYVSTFEKSQTDATNKAIGMSKGDYFIIVGSDDYLAPEAVLNFRRAIDKYPADLLIAKICINNKVIQYRSPKWFWLHGSQSVTASTAVSLCLRKAFFNSVGKFPVRLFPIKADEYFMLKALRFNPIIHYCDFISGEFSSTGLSNSNLIFSLTETFCVNVISGRSVILQLILLNLRLMKSMILYKHVLIKPSHRDL